MDIVYGGLYAVRPGAWSNDQAYYLAVPIPDDKGNVWMQDTYQLQRPSKKQGDKSITDAAIRCITESFKPGYKGYAVTSAKCNYYYQNQMRITSQQQLDNNFKLICDLRDYEYLPDANPEDYQDSDAVKYVKLFNEHGYSWDYGAVGVTLIRKGAKKKSELVLKRLLGEYEATLTFPSVQYNAASLLDEIDNAATKCDEEGINITKLQEELRKCKDLTKRLEEMHDEIHKFMGWR